MRRRARVDANHAEIVEELRKCGVSVQSLAEIGNGCPDLLCGFQGVNFVLEIKDGDKVPSKRKLTDPESKWHLEWRGKVVTVKDVLEAVNAICKS